MLGVVARAVVGAVFRQLLERRGARSGAVAVALLGRGVVEVELAQVVAEGAQIQKGDGRRQLVPLPDAVDLSEQERVRLNQRIAHASSQIARGPNSPTARARSRRSGAPGCRCPPALGGSSWRRSAR